VVVEGGGRGWRVVKMTLSPMPLLLLLLLLLLLQHGNDRTYYYHY